ncbi:serine hydrolase domain-containing protein [Nocardioides pelophilus]|uniref:serine hydrolase domain-containing protein n=1 Tax=Nocardioides pelophilus TaxID=2172019 RepID=UPI00160081AE|nr:serine hydrolase domain-containing protein [Nocardioides pelophilus]
MSRTRAVTTVLALGLLLAGCGSPDDEKTSDARTTPSATAPSTTQLESASSSEPPSPSPTASSSGPPAPFPTEAFGDLTEQQAPDRLAAALQATLRDAADGYGVTATVMSADGTWTGAVGHAEGKEPMPPDAQMAIGSVTKSIVAAQVMQLVEAGDLALDDPVTDHLPAWVHLDTNGATIRHLMAMRSGLSDYVTDEMFEGLEAHPRRGETWREVLARVGPPHADPGETFEYNNTNFMLLGVMIQHERGRPLAEVLRSGVLAGEGLDRLIFQPGERPTPPLAAPSAETGALERGGGDVPSYAAISGAGGAGAMASDALTLGRWFARFCAGEIVSRDSLTEMKANLAAPEERYGLGVMDEDGGSRPGMGHEGLQVGFASFARCLYEDGIVITVLTNEESLVTGDVVNALADAVLEGE